MVYEPDGTAVVLHTSKTVFDSLVDYHLKGFYNMRRWIEINENAFVFMTDRQIKEYFSDAHKNNVHILVYKEYPSSKAKEFKMDGVEKNVHWHRICTMADMVEFRHGKHVRVLKSRFEIEKQIPYSYTR